MNNKVEKYVKDGQVAILYSPGYGGGWSTWGEPEMAWDKRLVDAFLAGGTKQVEQVATQLYPDDYLGGVDDLAMEWVTQGEQFEIEEYDGSESVRIIGPSSFYTA